MVASKGMREWGSEMVDTYEHVQLVVCAKRRNKP